MICSETSRSTSIIATRSRMAACTARSGSLGTAMSARRSIPCAAQHTSTARQVRTFATTSRSFRTAVHPIDT